MKFHRVLLFTSIQMDVTPVGADLHVLLTNDSAPRIGATAYASPKKEDETISCETSVITDLDDPTPLFVVYVAEELAKQTGQNVLCTGGVFVENPDEHQTAKLYENIDELIRDWTMFLVD